MMGTARLATTAVLLALTATPTNAQERYAVGAEHVAIYNLAGELEVVGTSGGQVTVDVTRGGRHASDLRVEVGQVSGVHTVRVIYPGDRIIYGEDRGFLGRWAGGTRLNVRSDGTWGGDGPRGSPVRIVGGGRGLNAHADLRVGVPAGQTVELFLGVGRVLAENVNGDVRLDIRAGRVDVSGMAGRLVARTGSGAIHLDGMTGNLRIDSGSGGLRVAGVRGDSVALRTGSGSIGVDRLDARHVRVNTGSGGVSVEQTAADELRVQTGSGSVNASLLRSLDHLAIRTGSGRVTIRLADELDAEVRIRTGSGRIDTEFPLHVTSQDRRNLRGVVGEGRGTVDVRTGSGSVRILRR